MLIAVLTETGIFTWFAMSAMIIYTFSIWQRNVFVYRILGILVAITWATYCFYEENVVGILFEACLLVATIVGIITYVKKQKQKGAVQVAQVKP